MHPVTLTVSAVLLLIAVIAFALTLAQRPTPGIDKMALGWLCIAIWLLIMVADPLINHLR